MVDMLRPQLEPARDRLGVRRERAVEAEGALITAVADEGVDEEEVSLTRRDEPPAVGRDVDTNDGFSEGEKGGLGEKRGGG